MKPSVATKNNYMLKNFELQISQDHFPGYKVTKPFYIFVQYSIKDGKFDGVQNVNLPFTAIATLNNSSKLKQEIEDAALNNFNSLVKQTHTPYSGKIDSKNITDHEAYDNLKSQITY